MKIEWLEEYALIYCFKVQWVEYKDNKNIEKFSQSNDFSYQKT